MPRSASKEFTCSATPGWAFASALVLLSACGPSTTIEDADSGVPDAGPVYRAECENLSPVDCLLPWPSAFFLESDPATATGVHVVVPTSATPTTNRGRPTDLRGLSRFDGFSPTTAIATSFSVGIEESQLHGERDIDATLEMSSNTLIIDAESGELIPHFAELEGWEDRDPIRRLFYLRPARRLEEGRRYLVVIRDLQDVDGQAVQPSTYFAALRDNESLPESDIETRRAHFETLFEELSALGIERGQLLMTWDFVTATGETVWGDMVSMRDEVVGAAEDDFGLMGPQGLPCTVTDVLEGEDVNSDVYRELHGTLRVPLYLEGLDPNSPEESRLHRDSDGRPSQNGFVEVPFFAQIPQALATQVAEGGAPGRLEFYGHGLLGSRLEIGYGAHRAHAQALKVVAVSLDWWGMSEEDLPRVVGTLNADFSNFDATGERLHQSVMNYLALFRSFQGICSDLPEMRIPGPDGTPVPSMAPSSAYFYGVSQGGIMGGVVASLTRDIDHFILGVGGMSYPLMVKRSTDWVTYDQLMATGFRDELIRDLLMVVSASFWDVAEPSTYASHILTDRFPGTSPKRVLMQIGLGDSEVPNISAELEARTMGIPYLAPAPYQPWGLQAASETVDSALVYHGPADAARSPEGTVLPPDNSSHTAVREAAAALRQIELFTAPNGRVEQVCEGACDPD